MLIYKTNPQELYGVATVNLPESAYLPYGMQYVDINNYPHIGHWLQSNHLAEPTGLCAQNGFCRYPLYDFQLPLAKKLYIVFDNGLVERREPDGVVEESMIRKDDAGRFYAVVADEELLPSPSEVCNFYNENSSFGAYQVPQAGDFYFKVLGGCCFYRPDRKTPTGRQTPMGNWCLIGTKEELSDYVGEHSKELELDHSQAVLEHIANA